MLLAVYNSFPFHYEMFGHLLWYAKDHGHQIVIYTTTQNNLGWMEWYSSRFVFEVRDLSRFEREMEGYDLVVLTTDDDPGISTRAIEALGERLVKINHFMTDHQPLIKRGYDIRPYAFLDGRKWAIPCYPIYKKKAVKNRRRLKIMICGTDAGRYDADTLRYMDKFHDLHVVSRLISPLYRSLSHATFYENIDTAKLVALMHECDYYFYGLNEDSLFVHNKMSGYIPLAYGCCTPILTTTFVATHYGLKWKTYRDYRELATLEKPDVEGVIREREDLLSRLEETLGEFLGISHSPRVREINTVSDKIPKVIHAMWLSPSGDAPPPEKYSANLKLWETFHREEESKLTIKVWNNSMVERLIRENFTPDVLEAFHRFPYLINRCDFARMCVIYVEGGVYTDLDFYPRKNLSTLLDDREYLFFEELPEHEPKSRQVFNGFFASKPNNPFVFGWITQMMKNLDEVELFSKGDYVMRVTGPVGLYMYWRDNHTLATLSDPCLIMPYNNQNRVSELCDDVEKAYAYTRWHEGTGWANPSSEDPVSTSQVWVVGVVFLIVVALAVLMFLILK